MKTLTGLDASKVILDPIHGSIYLTQLELDIISTPRESFNLKTQVI